MQATELELYDRSVKYQFFTMPQEWVLAQQIYIYGMDIEMADDDDDDDEILKIGIMGEMNDMLLDGPKRLALDGLRQVFDVISEPFVLNEDDNVVLIYFNDKGGEMDGAVDARVVVPIFGHRAVDENCENRTCLN